MGLDQQPRVPVQSLTIRVFSSRALVQNRGGIEVGFPGRSTPFASRARRRSYDEEAPRLAKPRKESRTVTTGLGLLNTNGRATRQFVGTTPAADRSGS